MISVHATQIYVVTADRDTLAAQADALMEALLKLEEEDRRVHSAAVSVDLGTKVVEVEVTADAEDFDEAEKLAADRVRSAVEMVTGQRLPIVERHAERVPEPA